MNKQNFSQFFIYKNLITFSRKSIDKLPILWYNIYIKGKKEVKQNETGKHNQENQRNQ